MNVVLAWEKRLSLDHFCENAACRPDVDLDVVVLPGKHNFRRTIVSRGDVTRHLRVLDPGQPEIADFEIAVLVNENVAGLEVTVDDVC